MPCRWILTLLPALCLCSCQSYLQGRPDLVSFTCHGATDQNGDGELQPEEFDGLGKTVFEAGETIFFGIQVPGSSVGTRVYAALRSPGGKKRDYGQIGVVSDTVNTFGVGASVDRLIAWGGTGEWALHWGLNEKSVKTVMVTLK